MVRTKFDVIVVGSGPGGGIASYALARAGLQVGLVEAGPRLDLAGYNPHRWPYQSSDGRPDRYWRQSFLRGHFTAVGDRLDHGQFGRWEAGSLCWAGHSLRFGPKDFEPMAALVRRSRLLQPGRAADGCLREPRRPLEPARRRVP